MQEHTPTLPMAPPRAYAVTWRNAHGCQQEFRLSAPSSCAAVAECIDRHPEARSIVVRPAASSE